MGYVLAIVGASGLVGQAFLKLLKDKNFNVKDLRLFGNESIGKTFAFDKKEYKVQPLKKGCFDGCDFIFLFCSAPTMILPVADIANADENGLITPIHAQNGADLLPEGRYMIAIALLTKLSEAAEILPDLGGGQAKLLPQL